MASFMKGYLSISCLANTPQCDLSGLPYRLKSKQTRVRTILQQALSSKHLFWIHSSTSGRQKLGISTPKLLEADGSGFEETDEADDPEVEAT